MNARLARWLSSLYPDTWRERYGAEFERFLEAHASDTRSVLNVVGWAMYERLSPPGGFKVDRQQRSLAWMSLAFLVSIAAGINFYWTVADTPLATAMGQHAALLTSWNLVRIGSLVSVAAIGVVGIPVCLAMLRSAIATGKWTIVRHAAVPLAAALVTLAWLAVATRLSGGHWVPTPWDVTGDWIAPPDWPSLTTRWALSIATFTVMAVGLLASGVSLKKAIRQSDLSRHSRFLFAAPSILLAVSVVLMTAGVVCWGWLVEQYAASDFHARNGGFFNSTNAASWTLSTITFVSASVMALRGAGSALSAKRE